MNRKLLFSFLLWTLAAFIPAVAKEQLTVYEDGAVTNQYVPVYGYYADAFLKSEYVVDASLLADMDGKYITNLTWYLSTPASAAWGVTFQVFLKEVESTTLADWQCSADDLVWEGVLDGTGSTMSIELDTPYKYGGGNLLVGVYGITKGTYSKAFFYGETVEGASLQGHNASSLDAVNTNQRNFVPKTTFDYASAVVSKPTNLSVSDITPTSANVSWTAAGDEQSWLLGYKSSNDEEWTEMPVSATSAALEGLNVGSIYEVRVASVYADATSSFITTSFSTPVCADDAAKATINYTLSFPVTGGNGSWYGAEILVRHANGVEVATLAVTANNQATGTLDLCYDEPYEIVWSKPGLYPQYCAFQFTDEEGTVIYSHQAGTAPTAGVLFEYTPKVITVHKPSNFAASQVTYNSATLTWTPGQDEVPQSQWEVQYMAETDAALTNVMVNDEPSLTLSDLVENTTYVARVRAISGEQTSAFSSVIQFKTPEQFPRVTDLAASDVTFNSAVISWQGEAESYNLRYREAATAETILFESFESGIPSDWLNIDSDADGNNWSQFNPANFTNVEVAAKDGNYVAMSRSWSGNALTPDNWLITPKVQLGGTLKFWILDDGAYQETYGIYVSTRGTELGDFEQIGEDMLSPASTEWNEVSIDLSKYAGEEGYIAIRNYNCTDMDYMLIDAFGVYGATAEASEWNLVKDAASPYTITGLEPATAYDVEVQANYGDGQSVWVATSLTTNKPDAVPTALAQDDASPNSVTVSWEGPQSSYNLRYRKPAQKNGFYEDFENGLPSDWILYDQDGDGNNWYAASPSTDSAGNPTGFGSGMVTSASYISSGALTPDNWLVSPEIDLGGELSVWLRGQDPNYAEENFAIYISTTGYTPDDFVDEIVPETTATDVLTEYKADLSAYAGQRGWIAIRHFDVTDMFRLNLDNFYVKLGEETEYEWTTVENIEAKEYTIEGLETNTDYEVQVQGIYDGGVSEWTESLTVSTLKYEVKSLEELVEAGEEGSFFLSDYLSLVALSPDNQYIYVTNGEGLWARLAGISDYFNNTWVIFADPGIELDFSMADGIPTLTINTLGNLSYMAIGQVELEELDLTKSLSEPLQPCQVMTVKGYYDGQKLRAYSGENGTMGQGLNLAGDFQMEVGQQYSATFVVSLKEPWDANAPAGAPRRAPLGNTSAIDNIIATVLSSEVLDPAVTGIGDVKVDDSATRGEVQYFDIMGRYMGKSLDNAPAGLYIGTDGKKVRK